MLEGGSSTNDIVVDSTTSPYSNASALDRESKHYEQGPATNANEVAINNTMNQEDSSQPSPTTELGILLPTTYSTGPPSIVIPPPHLPLRRKASNELRSRISSSLTDEDETKQQSVAELAFKLRPETNRWSRDCGTSRSLAQSMVAITDSKDNRLSRLSLRPSTAQPHIEEDNADTLSPLLRPSISIPDYSSSRGALRNVSNNTEPAPTQSTPPRAKSGSSPNRPSTFWRDGGVQAFRESIMSTTFTNGSSAVNTSGSSVWTARSSRSTRDSGLEWQKMSDDELSIDECIDMYAHGFRDDPVDKSQKSTVRHSLASSVSVDGPNQDKTAPQSPLHEEAGSVKETPAADTHLSVGSKSSLNDGSHPSIVTSTSKSSDTLTDFNKARETVPDTASSRGKVTGVPRDIYGFKHESQHVTANRYAAWHKEYSSHLARRKKKWIYLMNSAGLQSHTYPERFPARSTEVKRYIRKGIPPEWRGAAWFFYGDGQAFLDTHPGLYDSLIQRAQEGAVTDSDRDHIERDLNRTFPDNIHFKPDSTASIMSTSSTLPLSDEPPMIQSLRRILEAYAIHHPRVGYCQSLNFLAGHLLLFMQLSFRSKNYEERAFALLCILTEKYLPGTHGMVLEGASVDIGVLMTILQETMPALWFKLDDNGISSGANHPHSPSSFRKASRTSVTLKTNTDRLPTVSLATTAWFMSCFVSTLPVESTCRVWDCLWYEGSKTIFRTALAIFKLGEKQIKKASDPMEVFQIVQNLPKGLLDANELMDVATLKTGRGVIGAGTSGFGGLSQKTVETRRDERRAHANSLREGVGRDSTGTDRSLIGPALPPAPIEPAPGGGLRRSKTRGTLRRFKSSKKVATPAVTQAPVPSMTQEDLEASSLMADPHPL